MLAFRETELRGGNILLREYNSLAYHFACGVCRYLHTVSACTRRATNKPVLIWGCPAPIANIPLVSNRIFVIWTSGNHTETLKSVRFSLSSHIKNISPS
jgi:hypothetical protein